MPDPIEELRRYGEAVEAAAATTDVEVLVGASAGTAVGEVVLNDPSSAAAGHGRRPWLIAAAVAAIVALGATALMVQDEGGGTDDLNVIDDPTGETFGYSPGWHELDPGPLSPRQGASVTWTGEELIVLGGEGARSGAAYNPATRQWREIAGSPFSYGRVEAVWMEDEVLAVGPPLLVNDDVLGTGSAPTATYDPATDTWRETGEIGVSTQFGTASPGLLWTGSQAYHLASHQHFDPVTRRWGPTTWLGERRGVGERYAATPVDGRVVYSTFGEATLSHDLESYAWAETLAAPATGDLGAYAAAVALDDHLLMVDCNGNGATLDLETWMWTAHPLPMGAGFNCRPQMWVVDGRAHASVSSRDELLVFDGDTWQTEVVPGLLPDAGCCTSGASTGDALLVWSSNHDTDAFPGPAYTSLGLYVPGPLAEDAGPTAPDTVEDGPDPTEATYLRVRAGEAELLLAPVEIQCLAITTDPCVDDVPWADDRPLLADPGTSLEISVSDTNWAIGDIYLQQSLIEDGECVSESIHVDVPDDGLDASEPWIQVTQAIPPGSHRVLATARSGDVQGVYQFAIESGPDPWCPPPTGPFDATGSDEGEAGPEAEAGPIITVIAGDVEGRVAPVGGYCWMGSFDVLDRCATDPSTDPDTARVLSLEPGGQLRVVLPEAGTIRSDLPWDASGENCGRLERTVPAEASSPTLITGTIPSGTHTLSLEVTVGDDTHRYQLTLEAGAGPACAIPAPESQSRLLPDFELFGLTKEELEERFVSWRDVTHGRDDRPE